MTSQFISNTHLQYATGIIAIVLLLLVILCTKYVLRIHFSDIGLKKFNSWNRYEKTYLLVIAPAGMLVFYLLTQSQFKIALEEKGIAGILFSFIIYMCWGFYQEWIYRGFIQTELTRRLHPIYAISVANLLYTMGPLHFSQLLNGEYLLIAATFMIGLIFGIIYHRSYNLYIPGILHGIGTWFIVGMPT